MTAILDKEKILEDIEKLSLEEQLELIERLLRHIRVKNLSTKVAITGISFMALEKIYGKKMLRNISID
jgi:hypothetical protein